MTLSKHYGLLKVKQDSDNNNNSKSTKQTNKKQSTNKTVFYRKQLFKKYSVVLSTKKNVSAKLVSVFGVRNL